MSTYLLEAAAWTIAGLVVAVLLLCLSRHWAAKDQESDQ